MGPIDLAEVCCWNTLQCMITAISQTTFHRALLTPVLPCSPLQICHAPMQIHWCFCITSRIQNTPYYSRSPSRPPLASKPSRIWIPFFKESNGQAQLPWRNSRFWYRMGTGNPGRTGKMSRTQCLPWSLLDQGGSSVKEFYLILLLWGKVTWMLCTFEDER